MYILVVVVSLYCHIVVFEPLWPCLKWNQRLHLFAMYDVVEHKQLLGSLVGHNIIQLLFYTEPEKKKKTNAPQIQAQILVVVAFLFSSSSLSHTGSLFVLLSFTLLVGMSDNVALNRQPFRSSGWLKKKRQRKWRGTKRTQKKKKSEKKLFFLGEVANNKLKRSGFVIDFMFNG